MTLLERQDKERKALINKILEEVEKIGFSDYSAKKLMDISKALKQVTTDPKTYFDNLDKKE